MVGKAPYYDIHLQGAIYSHELYDEEGRLVDNLEDAIRVAEWLYGKDGWEVYNGRDEAEFRFVGEEW